MTLYNLTANYLQILDLLRDGEYTEEQLKDTLEAVEGELEEKADNYAKVMKELEGEALVLRTEIDRLKEKLKRCEDGADRLKKNLYESMVATGKTKFKTELFSFGIQKNGGALPVIVDVETKELPDELVQITEKPDLKAIGEYLKEHPDSNLAHFGERGESLRIK